MVIYKLGKDLQWFMKSACVESSFSSFILDTSFMRKHSAGIFEYMSEPRKRYMTICKYYWPKYGGVVIYMSVFMTNLVP